MTGNYTAGSYVEAWCTKCRLELGHTIVAMVAGLPKRVKCNTCTGEHNYKTKPVAKTSAAKKTATKKTATKTKTSKINYQTYMDKLTEAEFSQATQYTIKGNFEKKEIIDHAKFGIGIVLLVENSKKIEVLFKEGSKLLIQNRK